MKKTIIATLCVALALVASIQTVNAATTVTNYEAQSQDGTNLKNGNYETVTTGNGNNRTTTTTYYGINDNAGGTSLYEYFNSLFNTAYESSNELFAALGVTPGATWSTQYGTWLYSNKDASYTHTMNVTDSNGRFIDELYKYGGSEDNGTHIYDADNLVKIDDWNSLDDFQWQLKTNKNTAYTSGLDRNGYANMIAFDITGLLSELFDEDLVSQYDSAYFIAWEDMTGKIGTDGAADWDYNDLMGIYLNVAPNSGGTSGNEGGGPTEEPIIKNPSTTTPEPATMLILGLGTLGAGFIGRRRLQK